MPNLIWTLCNRDVIQFKALVIYIYGFNWTLLESLKHFLRKTTQGSLQSDQVAQWCSSSHDRRFSLSSDWALLDCQISEKFFRGFLIQEEMSLDLRIFWTLVILDGQYWSLLPCLHVGRAVEIDKLLIDPCYDKQ